MLETFSSDLIVQGSRSNFFCNLFRFLMLKLA